MMIDVQSYDDQPQSNIQHNIAQIMRLHEMCTQELKHLRSNCESYMSRSNELLKSLPKNWQHSKDLSTASLVAFEHFQSNLISTYNQARQFNFHLDLNDLSNVHYNSGCLSVCQQTDEPTFKWKQEPKEQTELEETRKVSTDDTKPSLTYSDCAKLCLSDEITVASRFELPEADLSSYKIGQIVNASVSHIRDLGKLQFFIIDIDNNEQLHKLQTLNNNVSHFEQLTEPPSKNEIFGLVDDDGKTTLRAVLWKPSDNIEDTPKAYLLEFGEIVDITSKSIMYKLPDQYQSIPGQAIQCELIGIDGRTDATVNELSACLDRCNRELSKFKITSIVGEQLKLVFVEGNITEEKEPLKTTNPFLNDYLSDSDQDKPKETHVPCNSVFGCGDELTQDIIDELYAEPLSTTNAVKAVMGYIPKDEKRICRFYDRETGGCFKGATCKLEHTELDPDGWTMDTVVCKSVYNTHDSETHFKRGEVLKITPTHIEKPYMFYAHVHNPESESEIFVWNQEEVEHSKPLKTLPLRYDLVLAKYDDGLWYRAKVIEMNNNNLLVKVFFVDYGNYYIVALKDLLTMDENIAKEPFQAMLFRIGHVSDIDCEVDQRMKGIQFLCDRILNQTISVRVIIQYEEIIVNFVQREFKDIPAKLSDLGCVRSGYRT